MFRTTNSIVKTTRIHHSTMSSYKSRCPLSTKYGVGVYEDIRVFLTGLWMFMTTNSMLLSTFVKPSSL